MKKFLKEWWIVMAAFLAVVVFAAVIRIYNITLLPVFADEAIYIRWSQIMSMEPTLRFLPLSDGKQPLYMWILMFYVHRLSDPLFSGRILSVVAGLGTIAGIFGVSYVLFKNKLVSILSSLIWAVSPFSFFFDRMALVDSLLASMTVWTLFFGILTAKTKRLDMAMITGFFLGGALLTKSPALFTAILLPSVIIMSKFPKKPKQILMHLLNMMILFVPAYIIGYGMYNILRLGPNFNMVGSRNADYILPISHLWINPRDPLIFHIEEIYKDWFVRMGPWPIYGLIISGIAFNWKNLWREKLLLAAWFLFPILVQSEYAKVFTVRYILFTLPPIFILAASSFLTKKKIIMVFNYIVLAVFVGVSLYTNFITATDPEKSNLPSSERSGYLEEWTAGTGIREVSELIKAEHTKNPEQNILIGTEGYFGTLPDGLHMYVQNVPNVNVIGVGIIIEEIPQSLEDSVKFGNKTYLVINSSRLKIKEENWDKAGLKLISSYKKADRREKATHDYIWHGLFDTFYFFELVKPAIIRQ